MLGNITKPVAKDPSDDGQCVQQAELIPSGEVVEEVRGCEDSRGERHKRGETIIEGKWGQRLIVELSFCSSACPHTLNFTHTNSKSRVFRQGSRCDGHPPH